MLFLDHNFYASYFPNFNYTLLEVSNSDYKLKEKLTHDLSVFEPK